MTEPNRNFYGISEAARICGVKPKQLLYWEAKGYIPTPNRVELGDVTHRHYTDDDLSFVRAIKEYLDAGFTLPAAAKKAAGEMSVLEGETAEDFGKLRPVQ